MLAPVLGLTLSQFSSRAYRPTQRIALQVYRGGTSEGLAFDGVRYPSHNNFPRACYVLFERSAEALHVANDIEFPEHGDWPAFLTKYQVAVV